MGLGFWSGCVLGLFWAHVGGSGGWRVEFLVQVRFGVDLGILVAWRAGGLSFLGGQCMLGIVLGPFWRSGGVFLVWVCFGVVLGAFLCWVGR